jgi:hypothetical protein
MSQTLTYTVTVEIGNNKGVEYNATALAENITSWLCSTECESHSQFEKAVVTHESGVSVERT